MPTKVMRICTRTIEVPSGCTGTIDSAIDVNDLIILPPRATIAFQGLGSIVETDGRITLLNGQSATNTSTETMHVLITGGQIELIPAEDIGYVMHGDPSE